MYVDASRLKQCELQPEYVHWRIHKFSLGATYREPVTGAWGKAQVSGSAPKAKQLWSLKRSKKGHVFLHRGGALAGFSSPETISAYALDQYQYQVQL